MNNAHDQTTQAPREKKGFPLSIKQVIGVVLLVLVAIFCAQNTDRTPIQFFGGQTDSPLWVWLLGVLAFGIVIGILIPFGRKKD